jgi:hypothetical protein
MFGGGILRKDSIISGRCSATVATIASERAKIAEGEFGKKSLVAVA